MIEAAPAVIELFGGVFEGKEGGFISRGRVILGAYLLDVLPRERECVADVRLDSLGNERGPADLKIGNEERMHL